MGMGRVGDEVRILLDVGKVIKDGGKTKREAEAAA